MVRVHRWILDEKRQKLANIERFIERMRLDLQRLDENLDAERKAASESFEGTVAFSAFIAAAQQRREKLVDSLANMEREADSARGEVTEAFQELKKYESAQTSAADRTLRRQQKREQLALDEAGISLYRRRASGDDGGAG
jgi:flagellar export protein FliJ